jgi:hypothetical protein
MLASQGYFLRAHRDLIMYNICLKVLSFYNEDIHFSKGLQMSNTNLKHLEKIKDSIDKSNILSEEEKSDSMKRIEEWYREDMASGTFLKELSDLSPTIKALLAELGLI